MFLALSFARRFVAQARRRRLGREEFLGQGAIPGETFQNRQTVLSLKQQSGGAVFPQRRFAAFFADEPRQRVNFICSIGYGDPASIFDRSPRPDFGRFNLIV